MALTPEYMERDIKAVDDLYKKRRLSDMRRKDEDNESIDDNNEKRTSFKKKSRKKVTKVIKSKKKVVTRRKKKEVTPTKPKLAKLAKEYGGLSKLAVAIGVSPSLMSKVVNAAYKVSPRVAKQIEILTDGKLTYKSLIKM